MSAHAPAVTTVPNVGPFQTDETRTIQNYAGIAALAGAGFWLLMFFIGLFDTAWMETAWASMLIGMLLPTFVAAGALFFIAVHSIVGAVWTVPLRRIMEGLSFGFYLTAGASALIILFGASYLYDWVNTSFYSSWMASGSDTHYGLFHMGDGSKAFAMTYWRYGIMNVVVLAIWLYFQNQFVNMSCDQDHLPTKEQEVAMANHRNWSIAWLIIFALTFTSFVWDHVLALHVNWFSTMWGVYCFASAVQTFLCVLIFAVLWLRKGPLKEHVGEHHLHDLGTWMVAWSCFCAYIAFSQYMLLYYANLDEETYWYVMRTQNAEGGWFGYGSQYILAIILRWPVAFLGLMSQSVRSKPWALITVGALVLLGNWMDWTWLVQPAFFPNEYRSFLALPELIVAIGFAGGLVYLAIHFWRKRGLLPVGDPRLLPSINAEHLH